ncbi:hypothetical protein F4703DRAFT_1862394 [Phycomyces blakesleeanus]
MTIYVYVYIYIYCCLSLSLSLSISISIYWTLFFPYIIFLSSLRSFPFFFLDFWCDDCIYYNIHYCKEHIIEPIVVITTVEVAERVWRLMKNNKKRDRKEKKRKRRDNLKAIDLTMATCWIRIGIPSDRLSLCQPKECSVNLEFIGLLDYWIIGVVCIWG